jgi:solute carrier family 8 (sodium/calcium exchanger)
VFAVTATCSLFAYVWLYIIVSVSSPNIVSIWEGLLTFAFFPLLVIIAWGADRKFNFYRYLRKRARRQKRQGVVVVQTGDYDVVAVKTKDGYSRNTELDGKAYDLENGDVNADLDEESELLSHDLTEERRLKAIQVVREIRQKNPHADKETIDRILEQENLKAQPKSRAFYRIEATRKMVGSGSVLKAKHDKLEQAAHSVADVDVEVNELEDLERQHIIHVFFDPPHYTCMESCGSLLLTVIRAGGDVNNTVYVDFKTEDGTAKSGEDYERTEGTLCFKPGETVKTISVAIIDDDIFEEDEHFTVRLSNIRLAGSDGKPESYDGPAGVLGPNSTAEIVILDDDYPGVFTFEGEARTVPEADRVVTLTVVRQQGARGIVRVPYHTIEGTAKGGGEAFEDAVGELEFDNEEYR